MHFIKACHFILAENACWMRQILLISSITSCVWSEYAEALINPIKYISQLHKREAQLAVFLEDNCEVRRTICTALARAFANSLMIECLFPFCSFSYRFACLSCLAQHVPNQAKEGEPRRDSEATHGDGNTPIFDPPPPLDNCPDIIKSPPPGRRPL